jgi:hypothetical protein
MEGLTRLVSDSLARHGFDRPVDYRRLRWSRWFRCESHHDLLFVPSKPGVFALAEEIMDIPNAAGSGTPRGSQERTEAAVSSEADGARRMLAVSQFFEADDMAFVLDRMLSREHPMRVRLESGRYFVRFVVIDDAAQRRSVTSTLNQWIANSTEKATGIVSQSVASRELATPQLRAGAATNIHCSSPFPAGF